MRRFLAILFVAILGFSGVSGTVRAQDTPDAAAIQGVIRSQLEAFRGDDGATAYSFAAPNVKAIFPNPQLFMEMVKKGYPPVYRPRSYTFGPLETKDGVIAQSVEIVGPDGDYWQALYTIARQPDGSWKITSCHLVKSEGSSA